MDLSKNHRKKFNELICRPIVLLFQVAKLLVDFARSATLAFWNAAFCKFST